MEVQDHRHRKEKPGKYLKDKRVQPLAKDLGEMVHPMTADATDPQQVDAIFDRVLKQLDKVDGVVNCVGNVMAQPAFGTGLPDLQHALQVNLYSAFNIVKSGSQAMMQDKTAGGQGGNAGGQHGGAIVLVSAAVAEVGLPNFEAMSATKAGVEGLARSAAAGFAARGVRVNCVAPGLTRTPQTARLTRPGSLEERVSKSMHPLKQVAEPEDIASALEFFLRPENSFITGQVLAVDGGLATLHPHHPSDYGA